MFILMVFFLFYLSFPSFLPYDLYVFFVLTIFSFFCFPFQDSEKVQYTSIFPKIQENELVRILPIPFRQALNIWLSVTPDDI